MENYSTIDQFKRLENIEVNKEKSKKKKKRIAKFISSNFSKLFSGESKATGGQKTGTNFSAADRIKGFFRIDAEANKTEDSPVNPQDKVSTKSFGELIKLALDKIGIHIGESELQDHTSDVETEDVSSEIDTANMELGSRAALEESQVVQSEAPKETAPSYLYEEEEVLIHRSESDSFTLHEKTEVRVTEKPHTKEAHAVKKELKKRDKEISQIAREADELAKENETIQREIDSMKKDRLFTSKETIIKSVNEDTLPRDLETRTTTPSTAPAKTTEQMARIRPSVDPSKTLDVAMPGKKSHLDKEIILSDNEYAEPRRAKTTPESYQEQQREQAPVVTPAAVEKRPEIVKSDAKPEARSDEAEKVNLAERSRKTSEIFDTSQSVSAIRGTRPFSSMGHQKTNQPDTSPTSDKSATVIADKQIKFTPSEMSAKELIVVIGLVISLAMTIILLAQNIIS